MTLFAYNENIPFATNNPSVDQPDMETNTNSIFNLIQVDHQGFNLNQGGFHTVVHCIDNIVDPAAVPPAGPLLGAGEYYAKTITDFATDTAAFYQTAGGRIIQLTMNTTPVANGTGGNSFIPGGIAVQFGTFTFTAGSGHATGTITFNRTFPNNIFMVFYSVDLPNTTNNASTINTVNLGKLNTTWQYNGSTQSGNPITAHYLALGN